MLEKYTRVLGNAPLGMAFHTEYGELNSLGELRNSLLEKGKPFFDRYVSDSENHFANWIKHVFQDQELADELMSSKSYVQAAKAIDERIKYAELWLKFNSKNEQIASFMLAGYDADAYEPSFHKFETLHTCDLPVASVNKVAAAEKPAMNEPTNDLSMPVPVAVIPPIAPSLPKPAMPVPLPDVVPLSNTEIPAAVPKVQNTDEKQLLHELEKQFPGLNLTTQPPKPKGFFERLFNKK